MAKELGELGYLSQQDIELLESSFVETLYEPFYGDILAGAVDSSAVSLGTAY